ncbi:MAG: hypothetical protein Q9212_003169 [Teloschistes hypoglaucus]
MPRPTRNSNLPLADALDKTPTRVSKRHRQPSRRAQSPQRRQQEQEKDQEDHYTQEEHEASSPTPRGPQPSQENAEGLEKAFATEQLRRRKEQHRKDYEEKQGRFKERDRYHPMTREAREIRNNQEAESQRRREARQCVEVEHERRLREKSAEIAHFGAEEYERRQREDREARLANEGLPTSDLEEMALDERNANPCIELHASLRINGKPEWHSALGEMNLEDFEPS